MTNSSTLRDSELILTGLDGSNPLAFLAALGVLRTLSVAWPECSVKMRWVKHGGAWRPAIVNPPVGQEVFCQSLEKILRDLSKAPFNFDDKMPFPADKLRKAAISSLEDSCWNLRRTLDFLSAFGCDAIVNKEGIFLDSKLRMIRAGDSGGRGLTAYAKTICEETDVQHLHHALFENWKYGDAGSALRLDPNEDRQYALRFDDPGKEKTSSMRGANRLAIEGIPAIYTAPIRNVIATAGFSVLGKRKVFWTWPIWEHAISSDAVKSLISLSILQTQVPDIRLLKAIGVVGVYRCCRFASSTYYHNLSPARAVM